MFDQIAQWIYQPCHYVVATHGFRRVWLAGPYANAADAEAVFTPVVRWAESDSGEPNAGSYSYAVMEYHNGSMASLLGRVRPVDPTALADLVTGALHLPNDSCGYVYHVFVKTGRRIAIHADLRTFHELPDGLTPSLKVFQIPLEQLPPEALAIVSRKLLGGYFAPPAAWPSPEAT